MRSRKPLLLPGVWLLALLHGACASGPTPSPALPSPDVVRLQAGDAIQLAIKDEPTLARDYPVVTDGTVLLPFVGLVKVAGQPFDDVVAQIRRAYERELTAPLVVLIPLMRVAVSGEVRAPGIFVVDPTFTWTDMLARVGGVLPTAARDRLVLVRAGQEYVLQRSGDATWPSLPVRSGDRLMVPRRSWFEDNFPVLLGSATSLLVATVTTLLLR